MAYLTGYTFEPQARHVSEVQLSSVGPSRNGAVPPEYLTLYYGASTAVREMSKLRVEAMRKNQDLYEIIVAVKVQKIIVDRLTLESLKRTRMLNMERISDEVRDRAEEYWRSYLREEGKSDAWIGGNVDWGGRKDFIGDRLDLLTRLAKEPEFNHLALVVYGMTMGADVLRLGMILDRAAIKRAECRSHPRLEVVIPWTLQ